MSAETTTAQNPTATARPQKCVRAHFQEPSSPAGRVAVCGACKREFRPKRRWQVFCSTNCRRSTWNARRKTEQPSDIRATLSRIERRLEAIEILVKGV